MPNYQDPMRGGMPMQGGPGGMPQPGGTQMGGPQGPPQGQQGPPPPRPGPGQLGPGGGQQQGGQPQMPFMPGGQVSMVGGGGQIPGSAQHGELQGAISHYQQQLMMAQINGAPPQVIASLQMQLQEAQQAMQTAGMQAMYSHQMDRPQPGLGSAGSGGRGGRPDPQDAQRNQQWNATMQMLSQLFGQGGGGGFGIGG